MKSRLMDGYAHALRSVRGAREGRQLRLWGCLVAAGVVSLAISLVSQAAGNLGVGIICYVLNVVASNCLFGAFYAISRGRDWTAEDLRRLMRRFPMQLGLSIVITLLQSLLMTLVSYTAPAGLGAQTIASVCASLVVTLVSAGVAFGLYDGVRGFGSLLAGAWKAVSRNPSRVLYPAVLFIVWSFLLNIAYATLVSYLGDGGGVLSLAGNLVTIAVAGYFEVDVLLGLSLNFRG